MAALGEIMQALPEENFMEKDPTDRRRMNFSVAHREKLWYYTIDI